MKLCTPRFKKPYIELENKEDILKWELYKSKEAQDELVEIIEYKNNIINKAIEILDEWTIFETSACTERIINNVTNILKGDDNE